MRGRACNQVIVAANVFWRVEFKFFSETVPDICSCPSIILIGTCWSAGKPEKIDCRCSVNDYNAEYVSIDQYYIGVRGECA